MLIPFRAPEDSVRLALLRVLVAGLLCCAGGAAASDMRGATLRQFSLGQSIHSLSGRVLVNGRRATLATPIGVGDSVETAIDAQVVFAAGSRTVVLSGGARIVVEEPGSHVKAALRLTTGKLASLPGRAVAGSLVADSSTIGVRN